MSNLKCSSYMMFWSEKRPLLPWRARQVGASKLFGSDFFAGLDVAGCSPDSVSLDLEGKVQLLRRCCSCSCSSNAARAADTTRCDLFLWSTSLDFSRFLFCVSRKIWATYKFRINVENMHGIIPDICHFFYRSKIFGEWNLHQKTPIFRVKSVKNAHFSR